MANRIYAVQAGNIFKLVEAGSKNAAVRHVAKGLITVEVANQQTLVAAIKDGVQVEQAGAESEQSESAGE